MEGVPDLSAFLQGQLKMLATKKSKAADGADQAFGSKPVAEELGHDQTVVRSEKKKKKKKTKTSTEKEYESFPPEGSPRATKKRKKGKKRSREPPLDDGNDGLDEAQGDATKHPSGTASDERPKKNPKKKIVEASPPPPEVALSNQHGDVSDKHESYPNFPLERKKTKSEPAEDEGSEPIAEGAGSAPATTKLVRQIRGGPRDVLPITDLYFKDAYINAARTRKLSDGSMNFLIEKYDTTLKQTMAQLGSAEKLARLRERAIVRIRDEHKEATEKASAKSTEEKEILRAKFDELRNKLLSSYAEKKELAREKITLEREKAKLENERDAISAKLFKERERLRASRSREVTLERVRVLTAMVAKSNARFNNIRDYERHQDDFEKARNLYGLASGRRKCLEMIRDGGTEIPQAAIDMVATQERLYKLEVNKLEVGAIPKTDLSLSPLVFPSQLLAIDPFGSNVSLIDLRIASRLHTPKPSAPETHERTLNAVEPINDEETCLLSGEGQTNAGTDNPFKISDSSSEDQDNEVSTEKNPSSHVKETERASSGAHPELVPDTEKEIVSIVSWVVMDSSVPLTGSTEDSSVRIDGDDADEREG
ncbi:hypothetical protein N665_0113s0031 [Sinapis alba]|nr:hypothetical protein N665_0113s0031 [Sinapis alba]